MRNSECEIHLSLKSGWTQTYRKEDGVWMQYNPTGTAHQMTAEQLLSHLLPALTHEGSERGISVTVERRVEPG